MALVLAALTVSGSCVCVVCSEAYLARTAGTGAGAVLERFSVQTVHSLKEAVCKTTLDVQHLERSVQ